MESGPHLRAVINRKLTLDGEWVMNQDKTGILLTDFEAIDSTGKSRKVLNAGDEAELIANATIKTLDRILTLRANPGLYYAADVSMIPMITPSDGVVKLGIVVKAKERIDLKTLNYLAEVFVNE